MQFNSSTVPKFLPLEITDNWRWAQPFIDSDIFKKIDIITVQPYEIYRIKAGKSVDEIDIFEELPFTETHFKRLKKPNGFLFYNLSMEAFSYKEYNYFNMLTKSALKHNIPTEKIFLLTANLLDEENYKIWQKEHSPDHKINVFTTSYEIFYPNCDNGKNVLSIDQTVNQIRSLNDKELTHFLSLNRIKRPMRVALIYKIINSKIKDNTLISYPDFVESDIINLIKKLEQDKKIDIDPSIAKKICDLSPAILDYDDFENNFALYEYPFELYKKTLISIVSETLHSDVDNTVLYYTEKTFKPMISNHPIMIIGQKDINTSITKLGYKTYDSYFNLSFDTITNHWDRLTSQINYLEELNEKLKSMNTNEKIRWLLQDVETLEHNKQTLIKHAYTSSIVPKLINRLNELLN